MGNPQNPLQPGDRAPDFELPAVNREGSASLAGLRGRPFLIGFFRGLHCPFCRRQVMQLGDMAPALRALGVETVAVINTPLARARLYFRFRPLPILLLADPACGTHRAFGVPRVGFLPEDSGEPPEWPGRTTMARFEAARINPDGLLPEPMQPMAANPVLNALDGFELEEDDNAIFAAHGTQLVGHYLVDAAGLVAWAHIEAREGPDRLCYFPEAGEIIAAARALPR